MARGEKPYIYNENMSFIYKLPFFPAICLILHIRLNFYLPTVSTHSCQKVGNLSKYKDLRRLTRGNSYCSYICQPNLRGIRPYSPSST